jgi:hypothetical protein
MAPDHGVLTEPMHQYYVKPYIVNTMTWLGKPTNFKDTIEGRTNMKVEWGWNMHKVF